MIASFSGVVDADALLRAGAARRQAIGYSDMAESISPWVSLAAAATYYRIQEAQGQRD